MNTHSQLLSSSDTHVYYYIDYDLWVHVHVCLHVHAMILESAATIEQWIEDETMVFSSDSNSILSGKLNNMYRLIIEYRRISLVCQLAFTRVPQA